MARKKKFKFWLWLLILAIVLAIPLSVNFNLFIQQTKQTPVFTAILFVLAVIAAAFGEYVLRSEV